MIHQLSSMFKPLKKATNVVKPLILDPAARFPVLAKASNTTRPNTLSESELKPIRKLLPIVTASTPQASKPERIKGIHGFIQNFFYVSRLGYPVNIDSNKFFKLYFFPPEHFLGFFRKTRPAIRFKHEHDSLANDPTIPYEMKNKTVKSIVPGDYSYIRVKMRRLLRSEFLKIFQAIDGRDGFYVFHLNEIPKDDSMEIFKKELKIGLEKVKKFDVTKAVNESNKKINFKSLRRIIKIEGYDIPKELEDFERSVQKMKAESKDKFSNNSNGVKRQRKVGKEKIKPIELIKN